LGRREKDLEKSVTVGWLEFGSHEEVLHCKGCVTRHIAMVQEPNVYSFFQLINCMASIRHFRTSI